MSYSVSYHKKVLKFFDSCDQYIARQFLQSIELLVIDPFHAPLDIKPLQGHEKGAYRLRIGKYRFKYQVIQDQILIYFYDAGGRGDIY